MLKKFSLYSKIFQRLHGYASLPHTSLQSYLERRREVPRAGTDVYERPHCHSLCSPFLLLLQVPLHKALCNPRTQAWPAPHVAPYATRLPALCNLSCAKDLQHPWTLSHSNIFKYENKIHMTTKEANNTEIHLSKYF